MSGTDNKPRPPAPPRVSESTAALIVAFPVPAALALPGSATTIGRNSLAKATGETDGLISEEHLSFSRSGGAVQVRDVSRHGTWLNGRQIAPNERTPIKDGAVLRAGRTLMVYRERLEGGLEPAAPLGGLVGPYGLRKVKADLDGLKRAVPKNVLIEGETGTGKELLARTIAATLRKPSAHYTPINVGALTETVIEGEIFGYEPGAFTGAARRSLGIVRESAGGTVFFDEIGELSPLSQAKLLRLFEEHEVRPMGAAKQIKVDVLLIAATNRHLDDEVEKGHFREDLRRRFDAYIKLPALRQRPEDVPAVVAALAERIRTVDSPGPASLDPQDVEVEAMERLMLHAFSGNIRGLDFALREAFRRGRPGALTLDVVDAVLGASAATELDVDRVVEVMAIMSERKAMVVLNVTRGKLRNFIEKNKLNEIIARRRRELSEAEAS